jgi:DNA-binding transcriptional LysR family regulator
MIDKLEMFLALAEARHFGRAAEARGISQPSLSGAIRQLEGDLGVQLVRRGARFQGLTPEGERVLDWARRIVADARQMRAEVRVRTGGITGLLRLGVIPTALPHAGRLIAPLLQRHPDLRVSVIARSSVEILEGIEALSYEAGISYLDNEPLGRVAVMPLYPEGYRLLVGTGHALAGKPGVGWADLAGLQLCLLDESMQNRRILDARLAAAGVRAQVAVTSNSMLALAGQVLSGDWACIVSDEVARLFTGDGMVAVPIREDAGRAGYMVGLSAPDRDPPLPAVAALWDAARALTGQRTGAAPGQSRARQSRPRA